MAVPAAGSHAAIDVWTHVWSGWLLVVTPGGGAAASAAVSAPTAC
jgi:hypothetical protein